MVKNIITSKNTDYSTFLHCHCGGEILWFYYYHETLSCDEIIFLDYFGYLKEEEENRNKSFVFTKTLFYEFLESLIKAQDSSNFYKIYSNNGSFLILEKDNLGFYTLYKYINKKSLLKSKYIWSITIREPQVTEFIEELKRMKSTIEEWNSPEKLKEVYGK